VRRLIIDGPGELRIEDAPPPAPGAGELLVDVSVAGICGSDVHGFTGTNGRRPPGTVMGHEFGGTVVAAGPGVEDDLVGSVVAVNPVVSCGACDRCLAGAPNLCRTRRLYGCTPELPGAFANQVVVAAGNAVAMPEGTAGARVALVEPLSVGAHAAGLARLRSSDVALVIGGGPIGIAAALAAARTGAEVTVSEPEASRRELLAELGLTAVEPGTVPDGRADVVLECVGYPQTMQAAMAATRPQATIVLVGLAQEQLPIDAAALVMGERRILGSAVYTPEDFIGVAAWVAETDVPLERMIQERTDLDGLPGAFARYADHSLVAVKTLVTIGDR
jgi:2-desacetyl-2-hydroxyethyl bacteriochlorophyllide A dehydrogenase